ncbi:MAG: hypothetical protein IPN76_28990 [Saprospiraceae bacterium]|nr:hypothetical protein [Saprospiraceae bacterium]
MKYLHKILNNCEAVSLMALQSAEQPLSFRKRLEMNIHLYYCRCCSNFVKQSKLMDISLKNYLENLEKKPPFTASDDFKEKMKEQLK